MNTSKQKQSLAVLLNLFLVLSILVFTSPTSGGAIAKAPDALLQMAAVDRDQVVSVIVQKLDRATSVEEQVIRTGGKVTQDLHMINAFAAEMTAGSVVELARSSQVRWVSLDAAVISSVCTLCVDTTNLANAYIRAIRADQVWNKSPYRQGNAIGVAVVDSGINPNGDLFSAAGVNRQVADVRFNTDNNQSTSDGYGHGTYVASIIGRLEQRLLGSVVWLSITQCKENSHD